MSQGGTHALCGLPFELDSRQTILLDAFRYNVELAQYAYGRLEQALAQLARCTSGTALTACVYAPIYLDAWSVVDAAERFRLLWDKLPFEEAQQTDAEYCAVMEAIRQVRNVGDHISERVPFLVANNGSALGHIAWMMGQERQETHRLCALRAGTFKGGDIDLIDITATPFFPDRTVQAISLRAGPYQVLLHQTLQHMEARLEHVEQCLDAIEPTVPRAATGLFVAVDIKEVRA